MTVLVLTRPNDGTAGRVMAELERREVLVVRADIGDFPLEMTVTGSLAGTSGWSGSVTHGSRCLPVEDIRAIYYRRPTGFRIPEDLSPEQRRFATAEARRGIAGLLLSLPVRWLSHPSRVADAELKPLQLSLAAACGLTVPRTVLTNDAKSARELSEQLAGPMIYKPLSAPTIHVDGELRLIYATEVDGAALEADDVRLTAHLFQEWVPKQHDVRLTVIGHQYFAVAIYADSAEARRDWRSDYGSLRYEPIAIPDNVRAAVSALLGRLDLPFGAFDFAVRPDGEWVFLEVNANGQWGWIEDQTGLPITDAIADYLTAGDTP